jgi:hypothetical protein
MIGYRYAELDETFHVASTYLPTNPNFPLNFAGQQLPTGFEASVLDQFRTRNQFNGGTLGLRTRINFGYGITLIADTKISIGAVEEFLDVSGQTSLLGGGGGLTVPGGILALPSNSGHTSSSRFAVIPEATAVLSWQVCANLRVFGGYNIQYWSNVVRPSYQLDTTIDRRQVPIDSRFVPGFAGGTPPPSFNTTNFLANGFTAGVEIGY